MTTRGRVRLGIVAALVLVSSAAAAERSPSEGLEAAKQLYREGRFSESIVRLRNVLAELPLLRDLEVRRVQLADAHLHLALAHVALGEREAARQALKDMLRIDPERRLDPEVYAPKVLALLEEARNEVAAEPRALASSARPPAGEGRSGQGRKRGNVPLIVAAGAAGAAGIAIAATARGGETAPTTTVPAKPPTFSPVVNSGRAQIAWLSAAPSPGSTVSLKATGCPRGLTGSCTYAINMAFQVTSEVDLPNAYLTIQLLNGTIPCLYGFSSDAIGNVDLRAGVSAMMRTNVLILNCSPPFRTTNLTVFLRVGAQEIALQAFAGGYQLEP